MIHSNTYRAIEFSKGIKGMMSEKQMFGNKTRLGILILGYEKKKKTVPWVAGLCG